jgi:hypothetical protein
VKTRTAGVHVAFFFPATDATPCLRFAVYGTEKQCSYSLSGKGPALSTKEHPLNLVIVGHKLKYFQIALAFRDT